MTRVFVTCIGRCGSVSFSEACKFSTNYKVGHESLCGLLEYPDNHIEVSCHLRCVILHLTNKYPGALWVHLVREPVASIKSLSLLEDGAVVRAYKSLYYSVMPSYQPGDMAMRMYWAENDAIKVQLRALVPENRRREMHLETIKDEWSGFWKWIGADGDYNASLAAWDVRRNTTEERQGINRS
jgi:hypothetical protein